MFRLFYVLVTPLLFLGCATVEFENVVLDIGAVDNTSEKRIEVTYKNETGRTVCMAHEDWPNKTGAVHYAEGILSVEVDESTFNFTDMNTGYCIGEVCSMRISPNETISGFLRYEDFHIPTTLYGRTKKLVYTPSAYYC